MSNPNFTGEYSTNQIYRDLDDTRCLTDDLDAMDSSIAGKAPLSHTHDYAPVNHTHSGYASTSHTHTQGDVTGLEDALDGKAASNHTHTEFAPVSHTHSGYAPTIHSHEISGVNGLEDALDGKAASNHTHTGFAPTSHSHAMSEVTGLGDALDGKAASNHTHSGFAATSHNHAVADVTGLQTALDGKAASGHNHDTSYAEKSHRHAQSDITGLASALSGKAASNHTHSYNSLTDKPTIPAAYTHPTSHPASMITGLSAVATSGKYSDLSGKPTIPTIPSSLPANGGNADTVDNKHASDFADASHIHGTTPVTTADANLNDYNVAGVYSFAAAYQPINRPSGTSNGWLVVIPWTANSTTQTVKQFWLRHGSIGTNDHDVYVRTKIGDYGWSEWTKFWTTKDMTIMKENGDVYVSWTGQDVIAKISSLAPGMYTAYSRGGSTAGTTNAPNGTEGFRYLVHKTGENTTNYGWAMAFGTSGSVYAGYYDSGTWRGWRSLYTTIPDVLWSGSLYMKADQTVTPSKKLSECRNGWLLLWSDYDPDSSTANDADFVTTMIPKWHPSGSTWSGQMFLCDIPRFYGSDTSNVDTEKRIIKSIYIHDNKIVGHTINNLSTRTDVVLRAVFEF